MYMLLNDLCELNTVTDSASGIGHAVLGRNKVYVLVGQGLRVSFVQIITNSTSILAKHSQFLQYFVFLKMPLHPFLSSLSLFLSQGRNYFSIPGGYTCMIFLK